MDSNTPGSYSAPPPPPPPSSPTGPTGGGGLVYPQQPPKDPILVLVLNLFIGGVGYLIAGQKTKGIVAIIVWLVCGVGTCGIGFGVIGLFTAIDGYMQAQQLQAGHPVGEWTFFNDHR